MPGIVVSKDRCKGCRLCVVSCPQQILELGDGINATGFPFARMVDPSRCIGCRMCALICPDMAIEVVVHGTMYELFDY